MTKYEYHECGVFISVACFWVNSVECSDEFHVVFKCFQNLKNIILNILKEKLHISCLVSSLFLKIVQSFWKSTVETAMIMKTMIKFWYKFYIQAYRHSFTRDNSFLLTPFQSLPGKQKNSSFCASRHINNYLSVYLFVNSELQKGKSKEFIDKGMKALVKRAFKIVFYHQKQKCRRDSHEIFFNLQYKCGLLRGLCLQSISWILFSSLYIPHGCEKVSN